MESTDRPQVRDVIAMLQPFDPKARVTGHDFEITGAYKGSDCFVHLETDKNDRLEELEIENNKLAGEKEDIEAENQKLKDRLCEIKEIAKNNPEKLVEFILEGGE